MLSCSSQLAWNVLYDVMAIASRRPQQPAEKHKVLIVDDDRLLSWTLQRALESSAFEVVVCLSGEQATEEMQRMSFDLVITDFKMEGMNGLEVLEHARKLCPSAKPILMTAFGSSSVAQTAQLGGACYVEKPFVVEEFVKDIERMLDNPTTN